MIAKPAVAYVVTLVVGVGSAAVVHAEVADGERGRSVVAATGPTGVSPRRDDVVFAPGGREPPSQPASFRFVLPKLFRALSIRDLFSGVDRAFRFVSDPCSSVLSVGKLRDPVVAENCAADGLSDGVMDPRVGLLSLESVQAPALPETPPMLAANFVFEEGRVEGHTVAIDHVGTELDDIIRTIAAAVILSMCYESTHRRFCGLIERDAEEGLIDRIAGLQTTALRGRRYRL